MMLETGRLTAGYGRVRVLHEVSLDVGEGEIVALVGPNGAGKSTLLRAITAMIPDRSGTLTVGGRSLIGASVEAVAAAGVAHVPEGRRLFPGLTVRDNLRLGGWLGRNRDLGPVLEIFPVLGDRLGQVAGSLSGGEQQMCAIARALMGRPRLLLIDELSLGLAPLLVDEILARLTGIAAAGTGILLVEQDAGAALEVADRGYVLELGEIVLAGTTAELAADPRMRSAYLGGEWEADAAAVRPGKEAGEEA
ncbi:ABC transporter ATP-binding protein [Spirillospora sp. CA-128828]|uniref:ABC transporter ATP-binding protein n=1 Tax=Spirillospora sp. CA-128828 TaxID=3240033 RepID=UPI003D8B2F75